MKTLIIIITVFLSVSLSYSRDLNVYFISVGQGDAEYIELPNGKNALIDGGPSNTKISDFLTAHNISIIDYVVLTHPHSDHLAGLNYVFDNCQVNNFYDTRMNNSGASGDEAVRTKAQNEPNCSVYYPSAGSILSWDPNVTVKVLNAYTTTDSSSDGETINNTSIVLQLTYNQTSVLFTGDIQDTVEASLVSTYGDSLRSDVLKVAHHGSAYSSTSEFLSKVKPTRAYIEVGVGNTYGHPTEAAISRLEAVGATIYRTDTGGTLTYTISSSTSSPVKQPATIRQNTVKPAEFHISTTSAVKKKIKELKDKK
ncbi:MAG: hypothetical protein A2252_09580 [Elusimicrobia bacterium RIFOXYA2_FULL_39_19]|nr:MAG: hypothetical protein A2252_09580 [Elusimicrobia bacterium RIFOXYA2_FULL_39_19]